MSDFMRIRIITNEWQYEEYDIDSTPSPSLYPLQQGKVDKSQVPVGDYRKQGERENDKTKNNNDSR
jgi:hypothetical protein